MSEALGGLKIFGPDPVSNVFDSVFIGAGAGNNRTVSTATDASGAGSVTVASIPPSPDPFELLEGDQYTVSFGATSLTLFYRGFFESGGETYYVFTPVDNNGINAIPYLISDAPPAGSVTFAFNSLDDTPVEVCFLEGTLIDTPQGAVKVESLRPGDLVMTDGGAKPVKFVCCNHYSLGSLDSLPVCIEAGALGDGLPRRNLFVSGGHAVLVEGHLVQASVLINGSTIRRTSLEEWAAGDRIAYYNVELDQHSIISAEGLPVESYYDILPRASWENYAEYIHLYGEDQPIEEIDLPRILFARQLPAFLKQKLSAIQEQELVSV